MKLSLRKIFSFSFISQDDRKEGMTAFLGKRKAEFKDNWYLFFWKVVVNENFGLLCGNVKAGERIVKAYVKLCQRQ